MPFEALLLKLCFGFRNLLIDIRFGEPLFGSPKSDVSSRWFGNTDYSVLPFIFSDKISESDVIIDIGCGRGRVINWLLLKKYPNRIIGIEYDEFTAKKLSKRLKRYSNVSIIKGDALVSLPLEGSVFYLFNPFDEAAMKQFANKLKKTYMGKKALKILYYRPLQLSVFKSDPVWFIRECEVPLANLDNRYKNRDSYRQYAVIEFQERRDVS